MPKPKHYREMWCPWGRVSIQEPSEGHVSVVPGGAFNTVLYTPKLRAQDGDGVPYLATTCIGPQCPYYRKRLFSWGSCSLGHDDEWLALRCTIGAAISAALSAAVIVWIVSR